MDIELVQSVLAAIGVVLAGLNVDVARKRGNMDAVVAWICAGIWALSAFINVQT